ncbi:flagellar biosynthesis regulator FlaF [Pseudooceanicola sp.]|uniref:flagellar biosynthesis regulator FlaF n=1 Tax=Pseudooceanicola sp. TaxID=1914328 RepID=UPI003514DCD1
MSVAAYKRTIRESESPRQIEARVFARITGALTRYSDSYSAATTNEERNRVLADGLRAHLAENQKLWIALRDDLASPGNSLPAELRAQLLSLALWVERQSLQVQGGRPGLKALIQVNNSILAGLSRAQSSTVTAHGPESHAQAV